MAERRIARPRKMSVASGVIVAGVNHDLKEKRSIVHLEWNDGSGRRLFLPVPFGVAFSDLREEAEKALRTAAAEHAVMAVAMPERKKLGQIAKAKPASAVRSHRKD